MKKAFHLFVFLVVTIASVHAQKVYFIYLQTENQQPFYARVGEKIYNSNPSGYLILSNLREDSIYSIHIGIQGSQAPDQPYSIAVNRKDQGFLVKNFPDKGWGLFNLSTMAIIMPSSQPVGAVQAVKTEKREDNAFTNLLAKAADDSTIKERPVVEKPVEKKAEVVTVATTEKKEELTNDEKDNTPPKQADVKKESVPVEKKEEPKIDSVAIQKQVEESNNAARIKADSILAAKNREADIVRQEELRRQDSIEKTRTEVETNTEYKRSTVKLRSESSTTSGIGLVFIDVQFDYVTDTIRILIPPADNNKAIPEVAKTKETKFLDITPVDSVKKDDSKPLAVKNNSCRAVANNDDFFKLRKRMVGAKKDNNMIAEASRVFRTKCFSVTQIRNLSTLFLTDEFKYKFFDAAYQHVSDAENFASLQSELKDEYYINRFKAMLRF